MKRILAALAATIALIMPLTAMAAQTTPTPLVLPTETGEDSLLQQSIFNAARLKLGFCTATTTGTEPTLAATCNGAAGIITPGVNITLATVGALDVVTVTNDKVQLGDAVLCTMDATGAASATAAICANATVTAGQIVFNISNLLAKSPAAPLKLYFAIITKGNPN
jgi:hypothetical protein